MLAVLANLVVAAGIGVLAAALYKVRRLLGTLPAGALSRGWQAMGALIAMFMAGYAGYLAYFWQEQVAWHDMVVPAVFFLGAGFVWLTAALALQTALDVRRMVRLEQENITDPLIGIYNRRYLDRRLAQEVARARRYSLPLSVLLLDIDHFKRINDRLGHAVGDRVLVHLGRLLVESVRESEVIARYGGEEIVVIAPDTPLELAARLAERVRRHVETHALALEPENGLAVRIQVSIGVASLGGGIDRADELMQGADRAMYRAKQEGRNRVAVCEEAAPPLR